MQKRVRKEEGDAGVKNSVKEVEQHVFIVEDCISASLIIEVWVNVVKRHVTIPDVMNVVFEEGFKQERKTGKEQVVGGNVPIVVKGLARVEGPECEIKLR